MNRTAAVLAASAAALLALTACSTDAEPDVTPTTTSTAPATTDTGKAGGIPPEPTGAERTALLAALRAVNPALVADEDDAIDNARNQCSSLTGGGKDPDGTAQQRFSGDGHEVTAAEAKAINAALATFCKTS
ncbi:DUF732 domain-containing protein [Streptomyces sp. NPDC057217]|uniref:DUF732 domain-containing protein n=1 Tax=Streptomyces sp. NPDC057217 TaxID=3346054 RepID=UPI003636E47D